jgi:hypothetical protein
VYTPLALTVPTVEFPPLTPSTDQVTAGLLCPSTVALNRWVIPGVSPAVVGLIERFIAVAVTVTVALALWVVSTTLVAVTVCVPAWEGAVYIPAPVMVPDAALPPATESTDQVTAVLLVPCTVAVNCCCAPDARLTEDRFNLIVICGVDEGDEGCVAVDFPFPPPHPTVGKTKARISKRREKADSALPEQPASLMGKGVTPTGATIDVTFVI